MIRVLVVDDSPAVRLGIRLVLESDPALTVIGEARNGEESVALCRQLHPDIVTMDIIMPGMGGYEAICEIMSEAPCPILVLTGIESKDMVAVGFKALALGALSVLPKATLLDPDSDEGRELIRQIKLIAGIKVVRRRLTSGEDHHQAVNGLMARATPVRHAFLSRMQKEARLVVIGASTGGPPALQTILSGLPPDFPLPILVVQHISAGFSAGLANWLSSVTSLRCKLGEYGETIQPGCVYFAPDNKHITVNNKGVVVLDSSGPVGGHRPAINVLFESVARSFMAAAVGILLTGMGKDGAQGLKAMRQAGAYAIAQDEKSSVVFSMPAAAIELEAVDEILDLNVIAPWLRRLVNK
ncbi:MAG: two-component system chemotaxis family response regulator CheB [Syntrophaceae bacterium]|nr:MAG: two-component system chemotaxis family response regulator CheB [Syntrophaceae bacterium]